jgi:hypothetical protein
MSEFQTQVYLDGYAPSFSNGAVVPVSLDGAGRQRVAAAYQTTRPTLVNNQTSGLQANSRGDLASAEQFAPQYEDNTNQVGWSAEKPLAVSTNAVSFLAGFAVTNLVVKASAGKLYKLVFTNGNAAVRYLQIHNTTTLPADTAVPIVSIPVPIGQTFTLDLTQFGQYFSTGMVVCNSSTGATKTVGAADSYINAWYL